MSAAIPWQSIEKLDQNLFELAAGSEAFIVLLSHDQGYGALNEDGSNRDVPYAVIYARASKIASDVEKVQAAFIRLFRRFQPLDLPGDLDRRHRCSIAGIGSWSLRNYRTAEMAPSAAGALLTGGAFLLAGRAIHSALPRSPR